LEQDNKAVETLQQKLENVETAIENLARLKEFSDSVCVEVLHKVVVEGREKMSFYLKTDKYATMFVKMPFSLSRSGLVRCPLISLMGDGRNYFEKRP
jgi:hypothetical protein